MADQANDHDSTTAQPSAPVRVRRVKVLDVAGSNMIALDADDFAHFEECMTRPAEPNGAMKAAAALHKKLLHRS